MKSALVILVPSPNHSPIDALSADALSLSRNDSHEESLRDELKASAQQATPSVALSSTLPHEESFRAKSVTSSGRLRSRLRPQ